jgi:hypothetical protein
MGPFLIPEHAVSWDLVWTLLQALAQARHGISREIHLAILAAFALLHAHGLLGPVDVPQRQLGHL